MKKYRQVVLVLTHEVTSSILNNFEKISQASCEIGEAVILFHKKSDALPAAINKYNFFEFTDASLAKLNYVPLTDKILPGNNHFALMQFYLSHPHYDFYWVVEHDVRYSGDWSQFFANFNGIKDDFMSCHLRWAHEEPYWNWWFTLQHPEIFIPFPLRLRSFNPICRISNNALRFIHCMLLKKWKGHHEVLLPTLLNLGGFSILDFGGSSRFVLPGFENKLYTSSQSWRGELSNGTVRYRPIIGQVGLNENMLYHPVKSV